MTGRGAATSPTLTAKLLRVASGFGKADPYPAKPAGVWWSLTFAFPIRSPSQGYSGGTPSTWLAVFFSLGGVGGTGVVEDRDKLLKHNQVANLGTRLHVGENVRNAVILSLIRILRD